MNSQFSNPSSQNNNNNGNFRSHVPQKQYSPNNNNEDMINTLAARLAQLEGRYQQQQQNEIPANHYERNNISSNNASMHYTTTAKKNNNNYNSNGQIASSPYTETATYATSGQQQQQRAPPQQLHQQQSSYSSTNGRTNNNTDMNANNLNSSNNFIQHQRNMIYGSGNNNNNVNNSLSPVALAGSSSSFNYNNNGLNMPMHNHEPMSWAEQQKLESRELRNQPALTTLSRNRQQGQQVQPTLQQHSQNGASSSKKPQQQMINDSYSTINNTSSSFNSSYTSNAGNTFDHPLYANIVANAKTLPVPRSVSSAGSRNNKINNNNNTTTNNNNNSFKHSASLSSSNNSFSIAASSSAVNASGVLALSKKYAPLSQQENAASFNNIINNNTKSVMTTKTQSLQSQFAHQEENDKLRAEIQALRQQLLSSQNREQYLQNSLKQQQNESGKVRSREEYNISIADVDDDRTDATYNSSNINLSNQNNNSDHNNNISRSNSLHHQLHSKNEKQQITTASSAPSILKQMQNHPTHSRINNMTSTTASVTNNMKNIQQPPPSQQQPLGRVEYTAGPLPNGRTKISPAPARTFKVDDNAIRTQRQPSPAFWSKHHEQLTEKDVDAVSFKVTRMAQSEDRAKHNNNNNNNNNNDGCNSNQSSGGKWAHLNQNSQMNSTSAIPVTNYAANNNSITSISMSTTAAGGQLRTGSPVPLNPLRGPLTARVFTFSGFNSTAAPPSSVSTMSPAQVKDRCLDMIRALGDNSSVVECGSDMPLPPRVTHVVVPDRPQSVKALCALVTGRWVVTPQYVRESLRLGFWLDEESLPQHCVRCLDHPFRGREVLLQHAGGDDAHYEALRMTIECGGGRVVPAHMCKRGERSKYICISSGGDIIKICEQGLAEL